jgi:hypothetical protein
MTGVAPVSFDDLVPTCDPNQARLFAQHMYTGRDGYVVVTRISATGKHIVKSWAFTVPELLAMFEQPLDPLVSDDGGRWNVYISCAMHNVDPTDGGRKRGGKGTIDLVHEVRLDLDLKDESFRTPEEIDAFIKTFPIEPTLIINSGLGAKHCYWILDAPVSKEEGETLNRGWWAFAQENAGSVYIDRVHTADRIMRLPGTARWPKADGERPAQVCFAGGTGARIRRDDLWRVCEPSYYRAEAVRSEVRARADQGMEDAKSALSEIEDLSTWEGMAALARLEEVFNEETSWDQILVPYGWKVWKDDYEGRRHWVRPGKVTGTSATTDYPPSPNIMTLFSNDAHTGLVKLDEAGVSLTKMKVYAELKYQGDYAALTREIVRNMRMGGES